jgi:tRNA threonylcarbamoyladenosine biosynthesis protein TsaE
MARPLAGGPPGTAAPATLETRVRTSSADQTIALGARLGAVARPGDLVCLWGDLGAGKTQLAKGFALGLGIDATITSPTFILMAEYPGRLRLFHVDLYRLVDAADALAGGVIDDRQADGLTVVEWPDRMGDVLPTARLDVRIDGSGDEPRTIDVIATSEDYGRYVEAAR